VIDTGRVLIVDDETPVREVLSEYFASRGYDVVAAADGPEALAEFARERPDVVLLDMRMPRMDGMEVLRRLRDADPDVAVIMVTANDDIALARETLTLGAFDYVAKPFDFEHLNQTVATALFHSARSPSIDVAAPRTSTDVWGRLVADVFRVVRGMSAEGRGSTGARLEDAALAAARRALTGPAADAAPHLVEIELLAGVASDLGDLSAAGRAAIEAALQTARAALSPR
jgi:DNA-binding response OmpR family regulator